MYWIIHAWIELLLLLNYISPRIVYVVSYRFCRSNLVSHIALWFEGYTYVEILSTRYVWITVGSISKRYEMCILGFLAKMFVELVNAHVVKNSIIAQ